MNILKALLEFLASLFRPKPTPPVDPPVEPPVDPPPAQPKRVTKDDDFRTLPTITKARMREITKTFPFESESDAIWEAVQGRPLPLAQSWMESRYGQDPNAQLTFNPLGLFWDPTWAPGKHLDSPPLLFFARWADAFKEWARRMDTPTYKNGVYPPRMTLEQMIFTYVGGPRCLSHGECANGETQTSCRHYLDETVNRLNRYYGYEDEKPTTPTGYKAHTIPGLKNPLILPADIPVRTRMTPMGVAGRHGKTLQAPFQVTRHTTNNYQPGTGAWHHAGWQANGAEGNPGIAVHAYSDDKEIVIAMPFNEQGIHAGDWRNQQSLAFELCRQQGINRARAEEIAIALDAAALHAIGGNVAQNEWPHTDGGHCPDISMPWSEWERRVDVALQKIKAAA